MENIYIEHFWKWFSIHHEEIAAHYFDHSPAARYWNTECRAHLKAIDPELDFELWKGNDLILIVTAQGADRVFATVDELIDTAPYVHGWAFQALYPPVKFDAALKDSYHLTRFNPLELTYNPMDIGEADGPAFLFLYAKENCAFDREDERVAWQLIYDLVGERLAGTHFDGIALMPLESASDEIRAELTPIDQLRLYFPPEEISSLQVDKQGKMMSKDNG